MCLLKGAIVTSLSLGEYFNTLNYEQKQRYTLELSNKYLKAKERFYKEMQFEKVF